MNAWVLSALAPAFFLIAGAILCLLLEVADTPVGRRKRGLRTHLGVIGLLAGIAAWVQLFDAASGLPFMRLGVEGALALDGWGVFGAALCVGVTVSAIALAMAHLRVEMLARGEVFALLLLGGAGLVLLCATVDLVLLAAGLTVVKAAEAGLATADPRREVGFEASLKSAVSHRVVFVLLALAIALGVGGAQSTHLHQVVAMAAAGNALAQGSVAILVVVLLTLLPAIPFHWSHLDGVDGSPTFVGVFKAGGAMIASTIVLARAAMAFSENQGRLPPRLAALFLAGVVLTLVLPAIFALDQRRIRRLCGYLVVGQGGLVLVGVVGILDGHATALIHLSTVLLAAVIATVGGLAGLSLWESPAESDRTWEDLSGAGRASPFWALVWVGLLATLSGMPGTIGLVARIQSGKMMLLEGHILVFVVAVGAPVLASVPVLRLGVFLFAKKVEAPLAPETSVWRLGVMILALLMAITGGVFPHLLQVGTGLFSSP
jgi:NADH:ubiquinone oxidoreductase subunit 2 (subunit N)